MDAVRKLNKPVEFAMEATGHYWLSLYAHLRQDNQTVRVINPLQSDALRGLLIHETKTDAIDAFIIAEVVRIGRYSKTEILPENIHALRELCRQRFYIVDIASDIKRKVIALLDQIFPEYEKLFSDTFGVTSMEILANYQTPEQILNVDSQTLAELLSKASRGRFGLDKANQIHQYAGNSILSAFYSPPPVFLSLLNNTLNSLNLLNPALKFLTRKLPKFTTVLTANSTPSQASAKLLPPLSFLKLAVKSLSPYRNLLLLQGFIPKIDSRANR